MNRRDLLRNALLGATALAARPALAWARPAAATGAAADLAALERKHGGRLGVSMMECGSGRRIGYRADERFLLCSTFKLLAVAAVLAKVDQGREQLARRIVFGKNVLLDYAPVTTRHVGPPGMSVAQLCKAAITLSDNTAANLLLGELGGPTAVTSFARGIGDPVTRLDRTEPTLNDGSPGDVRDTTTPDAMLGSMRRVLLGDVLTTASRHQLDAWLRETRTGDARIRAGIPAGWRVGDKTGSGSHGEANDVAILWPPRRKPVLVAAYYAAPHATPQQRDAVLAAVGRIAVSMG